MNEAASVITDSTQGARLGMVFALAAEASSATRWRQAARALCRISGPGEARATDAARALLAAGAQGLVSWGTSGALRDSFVAGDLLLLTSTGRLGETRFVSSQMWVQASARVLASLNPQLVDACTVRAPLTGSGVKQLLGERSGCAVVDMESAAVAAVAADAGVPFIGIRAVVDPMTLEIPASAIAGMGSDGHSSTWQVLQALWRRPSDLPPMLKLGRHFQLALKSLSRAAALLAEAGLQIPAEVHAA